MLLDVWFWALFLVAVPVFWSLPERLRHGFLALASFGFLATLAPFSVLALAGWTLVFFVAAPRLQPGRAHRVLISWTLVLGVLGFLAAFKYVPGILAEWSSDETRGAGVLIPLGISYYTFKLIHYAVEVGRGGLPPHSLAQLASYLFLFPIFTAGPIERFEHYVANQDQRWDAEVALSGLYRIVFGLVKKFLLAQFLFERLYRGKITVETLGNNIDGVATPTIWAFVFTFYLYVYLDFSAYSDIAIGGSRLFGIRIAENFRYPLIAPHLRDYWRRWHISLSQWCQFYVYMPLLGLYRRPAVSLFATFLVMGLWHAGTLTRVGWGLYHALGILVHSWWARRRKQLRWSFPDRPAGRVVATLLTQSFIAGSMCFLVLDGTHGLRDALRLLARLFFLHLPQS